MHPDNPSAGACPADGAVKFSLRTKGMLAFLALATYLFGFGLIQSHQRQKMSHQSDELERIYAQEDDLDKASYALAHVMLKLEDAFYSTAEASTLTESIALDVELIQAGLQGLQEHRPNFAADISRLDREMSSLRAQPSRANLLVLRDTERDIHRRLSQRTREVHEHRAALWAAYRGTLDTMSVIGASLGLLGAVVFGAAIILFLTRLTWDFRRLSARAVEIVTGYRGEPLPVTRHDEVGDLMAAINHMQSELRRREQQLEISRQSRFHQEKMAAIGSIAAAVAHEINNPIAAIAGIAQSMWDAPRSDLTASADLILEQTRRIATISRQIAELTAPHSPEPELLDLNALVESTCSFIAYDRRFRNIDLQLELDRRIPAVIAIADYLTQVLMNLLINSADALENLAGRKPGIHVASSAYPSGVLLEVRDNGQGMSEAVLARAFEEAYTTKPVTKGRGLGLFLCRALLEECGGRIELKSTPDAGSTASVYLPVQQPGGA